MLKLNEIHTYYGNIQALKGISLEIKQGEIVTLIGANGAGKSTTLMSICGLVPPRSGEITFHDEPIHDMSPNHIVAKGICQVPEGRRIFPYLSVLENLDMGAFLRNDNENIEKDLAYVFELFPILAERRNQAGGTLSGGEQQMLAISRALMARPKLLLLDEPSLGLAPLVVKRIFEIIKKINSEQNTTIFLVEQNANLALKVANRGYVMENGSITLQDTSDNLLANEKVREAYLGI
jgi:branched-chain amino acid transport system ATP-binding protein